MSTEKTLPRVAVVMAAGMGKRMRSERPKPLFEVAGRPLLAWVLDAARAAGCRQILIVVGHGADAIRAYFPDPEIIWVEQREQKGTGHALLQAEPFLRDPALVFVLSADVPLLRPETLEALAEAAASGWGALAAAELEMPGGLGRVIASGDRLERIVEARDASPAEQALKLTNAGIYALPAPEIFTYLQKLEPHNAQNELYLTDALGAAVLDHKKIAVHRLADPSEGLGINDRRELAVVHRLRIERHLDELMRAGVTILEPARTMIEPSVRVGRDTLIHPDVSLFGHTIIGAECEIQQGSWIRDSRLGDGIEVQPYSLIDGAEIADDCFVGPFARLRPASVLLRGARVGNFVELKKTKLGVGAKASHLTYLGDAEVGDDVNIGAGVVTCNYDGVNKHETKIGAGAFIGSDTMLVAPIVVGARATTAAGSTITQNVPDDALAVARERQRNIPDWSHKKKSR